MDELHSPILSPIPSTPQEILITENRLVIRNRGYVTFQTEQVISDPYLIGIAIEYDVPHTING